MREEKESGGEKERERAMNDDKFVIKHIKVDLSGLVRK